MASPDPDPVLDFKVDLKRVALLMGYAAHEHYIKHRETNEVSMSQYWHTGDKVYQELRNTTRALARDAGLPDDFSEELEKFKLENI